MNQDFTNKNIYPPVSDRLKAVLVDGVFVFAVAAFFTYVFSYYEEVNIKIKAWAFVLTFFLYDPLMVSFCGGTVGHRMFNLRVKNEYNPTKNINIFAALIRFVVKSLLGILSFIFAWFDDKKQALHDMLVSSVVVYPKQKYTENTEV